jgi:glyoxylase-like metal-dependent hydrolase (beta-lactamase superfamily II)
MPLPPARPTHSQPRLRSLLAPNPSPLTHLGTNTYLLGSGSVAVIDPGPDSAAHLDAIRAALEPGERISHILVTHAHRDHSALAPTLAAATGAPIIAFGTATEGRSPLMQHLAASGLTAGGDGLDLGFAPDLRLKDGATLTGPDWQITALHTPGHLGGHLCFAAGAWLFSGDHVMGWSTSVIAPPDGDMQAYLAALARLDRPDWTLFLPGHGDPIPDPQTRVRALIAHREARTDQIRRALAQEAADASTLARRLYPNLTPALLPAAQQNVLAHLIDLFQKNEVTSTDSLSATARFYRI